ncbi:MAG: ATP-dependent Clp protease ATP-binding subunit [Acidobacteriaceae bacterium]|nr:ATP-dependent Clp protease ATP-binding subunit [Acidobacteriaceae bacterium]MBV9499195.1 ATP-dependent Clp protease ATP-binding subunit [Acidobacteriaceae bacterium]
MSRLRKVLDPTRTGKDAESLEKTLLKLIVGQDEAIEQIVNIYQMHVTGLSAPGRPIGNFLFLGPTGSGKTRTVEATAEALLGNPRAVIKIDCAEFQHSHEIAKLIGSPPGYLGHRETHPLLSQEVINQYHTETVKLSFILFDEIEKASDALWNLLLGILDKATLTLGDNRKVDFSKAMIFMTSNLGASEMSALVNPRLGFQTLAGAQTNIPTDKLSSKMSKSGVEAARRKFTPEFMNRIDKVVVFKPLGEPELRRILDLELGQVQQRILTSPAEKSFVFTVSDPGKNFLLAEGTDVKYGARHLKRAIERLLVHPLSNLMATNQVNAGDWIQADLDTERGCLLFTKEAEGLEFQAIAKMMGGQIRLEDAVVAAAVAQPEHSRNIAKPAKK